MCLTNIVQTYIFKSHRKLEVTESIEHLDLSTVRFWEKLHWLWLKAPSVFKSQVIID